MIEFFAAMGVIAIVRMNRTDREFDAMFKDLAEIHVSLKDRLDGLDNKVAKWSDAYALPMDTFKAMDRRLTGVQDATKSNGTYLAQLAERVAAVEEFIRSSQSFDEEPTDG